LGVLNLNWFDTVTGSLEDLEGLVNLRVLEMDGVKEVVGSLSYLQNMPLTVLGLLSLSKVEGSLSHLRNLQLTFLDLYDLSKVEGSLSHLQIMQLTFLSLTHVSKVEGSISHIQNMPLTFLSLGDLSKVEGSLSHIENMPLSILQLFSLSKVEGSVSHIQSMQLKYLSLGGTSVSGTPSQSLVSRCKEPTTTCIFTPAPKMCEASERIVGLTCEPCPNCGANGECLYGMDESDYLCESCHSGEFKVRQNGQGGREG